MAAVSRPGVAGSELLPQARATSARAAGSVTGRPMGSSPGSAPASTAPRSPARRGTQASRAPDATASVATAASAPGTSASRSPTRITAPGTPSACAGHFGPGHPDRARSPPTGVPARQRGQRPGLVAGQGGQQLPGQLDQPGAGQRGDREHPQAMAPDRLAQPQEDDGRLVLRLEAGQQHGRGLLQVGVADADAAPGHARGQELLLLGRVRAGPHVDVVGVQGHPGELGVGVGVLEGQPPAGQHADAARGPCRLALRSRVGAPRSRPAAATASACGQDAGTSTPFSSLTSGVVSRSGWVA